MAQQDLRSVYLYIVDDVVSKMKPEFVTAGIDESVLLTLRERWQARMDERGLLDGPDANRDNASSRAKADELCHPSTSRQAANLTVTTSTALPGNAPSTSGHVYATGSAPLPDSRKRPFDGTGPVQPGLKLEPGTIPQQDGTGDAEGGGDEDEDDGEAAGAGGDEDDDQEELNDDDLALSDEEDKELEAACPNSLICLYEKVHRSKSRWRCVLRCGVFSIDGKEYLFNKASADLQF